jgi:hypothetical protein
MTEIGRGESPSVFFLRNNWGLASNSAGDTRRALEQYDEALRIAVQRSIGGEPPPYLLVNRASALRASRAIRKRSTLIVSRSNRQRAPATKRARRRARVSLRHILAHGRCTPRRSGAGRYRTARRQSVPADSVPAMVIMQVQARIDARMAAFPKQSQA